MRTSKQKLITDAHTQKQRSRWFSVFYRKKKKNSKFSLTAKGLLLLFSFISCFSRFLELHLVQKQSWANANQSKQDAINFKSQTNAAW